MFILGNFVIKDYQYISKFTKNYVCSVVYTVLIGNHSCLVQPFLICHELRRCKLMSAIERKE